MATAGYLFNERPPVGMLIAQAVGITASTYLLGNNASLSFITIPTIMLAPAPLAARQWKKVYDIGIRFALPLAAVSALSTAYVAYNQDPSSLPFKLNVAATLISPSFVPFTMLFMVPLNNEIMRRAQSLAGASLEDSSVEASTSKGETVHALVDKWGLLNLGRVVITGAAVVCSVWAALLKREPVGANSFGFTTGANRIS